MRLRPLLLATAIGLSAAAPAQAATTFDLGAGQHPDVAVDSAGAGHFVWDQTNATGDDVTVYCQVPSGGTACAKTRSFNFVKETIGRSSYVFTPSANRVVIASSRCCTSGGNVNVMVQSTDNGTTFSEPVQIGTAEFGSTAVFGPGESVFGGSVSTWQSDPLAGSTSDARATLTSGFPIPVNASGGLFNATTPVVAFSDGDNVNFSFWNGAGDINAAANWTGPASLGAGNETHVAGGPNGLALLTTGGEAGAHVLQARKFTGAAFGAAVGVSEVGDPIFADLFANPTSGELVAAWVDNRSPNEWRIARSKDGGSTWTNPIVLVRGDTPDQQFNLQVADGADGKGFLVSDQNSQSGHVVAAPLVPLDAGGTSTDTPVDTVTVGGVEVSLIAPTACVTPPQSITLKVTSKIKKKLSPTRRVRITIAVFSVDKKTVKDKKAAFKGKFATIGFQAGSKHPLKALVTLKPLKGKAKAKKKTLKGSLTVCG
jgi:hypothetical protein